MGKQSQTKHNSPALQRGCANKFEKLQFQMDNLFLKYVIRLQIR